MQTVSGGDKSFEQMVTQQFIENIPDHLQKLTTAYENKDFKDVELWAHDLKSSIAIMGLHPLLKENLIVLKQHQKETLICKKYWQKYRKFCQKRFRS